MISFASDNWSPAHPVVLKAVIDANSGPAPAYGNDEWTARCQDLFKREFGPETVAFPVFGGTAANVLSVASMVRQNQYVLCADSAHMHVDEAGASERFAGCKLLTAPSVAGRLSPEAIRPLLRRMGPHEGRIGAVSITQSTERGTTYTLEQLLAIAGLCRANGLPFHVDGARLSNAASFLDTSLKSLTTAAGVDVLSFGGTKNGLLGAEAVVFLEPKLARDFEYTRLQGLNLASKMRFLSAQLVAYLENGLWKQNAAHANAMTQRLYGKVKDVAGVKVAHMPEANILFATMPPEVIAELKKSFSFYELDPVRHEVRFVTSWNTTEAEVDALADAVADVLR